MKKLVKKIIALLLIVLTSIWASCQILANTDSEENDGSLYKVFITRARNNGKYYWDDNHYHDTRINDFYVGKDKDTYSYFCLDGGRGLRDYDVSYDYNGESFGTYTKKYSLDESNIKDQINTSLSYQAEGKNTEAIAWLINNMYVVGSDEESENYMKENLNKIIEEIAKDNNLNHNIYAPGTQKVDVNDLKDKELLEIVEQMVVWSFTNNKEGSYNYETYNNKTYDQWKNGLKTKSGYQDNWSAMSEIDENDNKIIYTIFKALYRAANNKSFRDAHNLEIGTEKGEFKVEKGSDYKLEPGIEIVNGKYTNKIGPLTITTKNKEKIEKLEDNINILGGNVELSDIKYSRNNITYNSLKDLITTDGEIQNVYIEFKTNNRIDGRRVVYQTNAEFKTRVSQLKANIYTGQHDNGEWRQPILQIKKELNKDIYPGFILTSGGSKDIALTNTIYQIKRSEQTINFERFVREEDSNYIMYKQLPYVQYGDEIYYKITIHNEGTTPAKIIQITDYANSYLGNIEIAQEDGIYIHNNGTREVGEFSAISNGGVEFQDLNCRGLDIVLCKDPTSVQDDGIELEVGGKLEIFLKTTVLKDIQEDISDIKLENFAEVSQYVFKNGQEWTNYADHEGIDSDSHYETFNNQDERKEYVKNCIKQYNAKIAACVNKMKTNDPFSKSLLSIEDDDDIELVKIGKMDLALRQFVSKVYNEGGSQADFPNKDSQDGYKREPMFTVRSAAELATNGTAKYFHVKDPIKVKKDNLIEYSIRVYNEGYVDAKISKVTQYLPMGLEYYGCEGGEVKSENIKTDIVNGQTEVTIELTENNTLHAGKVALEPIANKENTYKYSNLYRENEGVLIAKGLAEGNKTGMGFDPQYVTEVKIICKVNGNESGNLVNVAEISESQCINNKYINDNDSKNNNVFKFAENNAEDTYKISNLKEYKEKYIDTIYEKEKNLYYGLEDDDDFEIISLGESYILQIHKVNSENNNESIPGIEFGVTATIDGGYTEGFKGNFTTDNSGYVKIVPDQRKYTALIQSSIFDRYEIKEISDQNRKYYDLKDQLNVWIEKDGTNIKYASFSTVKEETEKEVLLSDLVTKVKVTLKVEGNIITLTVPNKPKRNNYTFNIAKEDTVGNKINNVSFNVKYPNGTEKIVGPTNNNGIAEITSEEINYKNVNKENEYDEYKIKEVYVAGTYYKMTSELSAYIKKEFKDGEYQITSVSFTKGQQKLEDTVRISLENNITAIATIALNQSNNVITLTIPNQEIKGEYTVKIKKVDQSNNPLSGAEFYVNGVKTNTTKKETGGIVDGASKIISAENVGSTDVYSISEANAPKDYYKISNTLKLQVKTKFNNSTRKYEVDSANFEDSRILFDDNNKTQSSASLNIDRTSNVITVIIPNKPIIRQVDLSLTQDIVKVNDKTSGYGSYISKERDIGKGRYEYIYKNSGDIIITYEICLKNDIDEQGIVNSIVEYYSNDLQFNRLYVGENFEKRKFTKDEDFREQSISGMTRNSGNVLGQLEKGKDTFSNLNISLNNGEQKYIYLEYKFKNPRNALNYIYKNYAEIASCTPNNDIDSQPGNLNPGTVKIYRGDSYGYPDQDDDDNVQIYIKQAVAGYGKVFLDEPDSYKLQYENERIGDGIYQLGESGIKNAIAILKKENGEEICRTRTDSNGNYSFSGLAEIYRGYYYVEFQWGEGTNTTIGENGGDVTVDNYKSTIWDSSNRNEKTRYGNNWHNRTSTRYSDAQDDYNLRQQFDDQNKLNNTLNKTSGSGNAVMIAKTPVAYVPEKTIQVFDHWRRYVAYYEEVEEEMEFSYTDPTGEVHYHTTTIHYRIPIYDYEAVYRTEIVPQDPGDVFVYVDLGLIERPHQSIEIDKNVNSIEIKTDQGQEIAKAHMDANNKLVIDSGSITSQPKTTENAGWIRIETDKDLLDSGTNAQVEYKIVLKNTSEYDYANKDYYLYGTNHTNLIGITATGIEDYISGLSSDVDKNKEWKEAKSIKQWNKPITITQYMDTALKNASSSFNCYVRTDRGMTKIVKEEKGSTAEAIIRGFKSDYYDYMTDNFNNVIANNYDIFTQYKDVTLQPQTTKEIYYSGITQLSSDNKLEFDNIVQIGDVNKTYKAGSSIMLKYSNFFNRAQKIIITPPTGENKDYISIVILCISSIIILGVSIVFIRKIAIK